MVMQVPRQILLSGRKRSIEKLIKLKKRDGNMMNKLICIYLTYSYVCEDVDIKTEKSSFFVKGTEEFVRKIGEFEKSNFEKSVV